MYFKHLKNCSEFVAGDNSLLREILNPKKEDIPIHYSLAWAMVKSGEKTLPHIVQSTEVYYILKGVGTMHINEEKKLVKVNDTVYVPSNAVQYIENKGNENLEFLCIVDPAWQPEIETIIENGK